MQVAASGGGDEAPQGVNEAQWDECRKLEERLREEKRLLSLLRKQALEAQCEEMATQLAARSLPAVVCLTWDATSGASADGWVFMPAVVVQLGDGDDEAEDGRTLTALGSDNRWCAHHPLRPHCLDEEHCGEGVGRFSSNMHPQESYEYDGVRVRVTRWLTLHGTGRLGWKVGFGLPRTFLG